MRENDIYVDQEQMYRLFRNEHGQLGIAVLSGGIGMYEVKMLLTQEEQVAYAAGGKRFLDELAFDVARHGKKYEPRTFG